MERKVQHSQNFLHSSKLVNRLVENSLVDSGDLVIEIGPGKGIITKALANRNCRVIAIEIDESLATKLVEKFRENDNIKIIQKDFMSFNLPKERYNVFANIPFNMTAEIIQKLVSASNTADEIYLVMQYEATLKYAGMPYYSESLRSLMYKPYYEVSIEYEFSPSDFFPIPKAKIVLAHFHKKEKPDIQNEKYAVYCDFLNYIFTVKGRTFKEKTRLLFTYEQQKRLHRASGIPFDAAISEITYAQWIDMFNCFLNYVSPEKQLIIKGAKKTMERSRSKLKKVHRNRKAIKYNESEKKK